MEAIFSSPTTLVDLVVQGRENLLQNGGSVAEIFAGGWLR